MRLEPYTSLRNPTPSASAERLFEHMKFGEGGFSPLCTVFAFT